VISIRPDKNNNPKFVFVFGYGEFTAIVLSWIINKSVWWVLFQMLFGWYYVIYAILHLLFG